jgi:hypothetical protein
MGSAAATAMRSWDSRWREPRSESAASRQRELLTAEAGDEAAAAHLATGFQAAKDAQQVAPFGGIRLAGEKIAKEDAVAGEEDAGEGFDGGIGAAGLRDLSLCSCGGARVVRSHP